MNKTLEILSEKNVTAQLQETYLEEIRSLNNQETLTQKRSNSDLVDLTVYNPHISIRATQQYNNKNDELSFERVSAIKFQRHVVDAHTKWLLCVLFMEEKQLICTSGMDSDIKIWNKTTLECIAVLIGHTGSTNCLIRVSEDQFASHSSDSTIKVWNLTTMQEIQTIKVDRLLSKFISALNGQMILGGASAEISVWWKQDKCNNYEYLSTLPAVRNQGCLCHGILEIAPNIILVVRGNEIAIYVATRGSNSKIQLKLEGVLVGHHRTMIELQAGGYNNEYLMGMANDATVRIWNLRHKKCVRVFQTWCIPMITSFVRISAKVYIGVSQMKGILIWNIYNGARSGIQGGKNKIILLDQNEVLMIGRSSNFEIWTY